MPRISARGRSQRVDEESAGSGENRQVSTRTGEDRRESTRAGEESTRVAQRHLRQPPATPTGYNANLSTEWAAASVPSGPVVEVRVQMTDACRQGRAQVFSVRCSPIQPSPARPSQAQSGRSRPPTAVRRRYAPPRPINPSPRVWPEAAQSEAEKRAVEDQRRKIRFFQAVMRVNARPAPTISASADI